MTTHTPRKLTACLATLAVTTAGLAASGISSAHAAITPNICGNFQQVASGLIVNGNNMSTGSYRLYRQMCFSTAWIYASITLNGGITDATVNVYSGYLNRVQTTTAHYPFQPFGATFQTSNLQDCYSPSCSNASGTTSDGGSFGPANF